MVIFKVNFNDFFILCNYFLSFIREKINERYQKYFIFSFILLPFFCKIKYIVILLRQFIFLLIKITTTMKFFINESCHIVNFVFTPTQWIQNLQYDTKVIEMDSIWHYYLWYVSSEKGLAEDWTILPQR